MYAQPHAYVCGSILIWLVIDTCPFKMKETQSFPSSFCHSVLNLYLHTNTEAQEDLVSRVSGEAAVAPGDPHVLVPTESGETKNHRTTLVLSERRSTHQ